MADPKILVVLDFDHTMVNGNTDTWITKLEPQSLQLLKAGQKAGSCWTDLMKDVFLNFHKNKITQKDYEQCLQSLLYIKGMKELCQYILKYSIPAVIISDSNSYFIDFLLKRERIEHAFFAVFTNPAQWTPEGCLDIQHHHTHQCSQCPKNLCKGKVLKNFLTDYKNWFDVDFEHIFYCGDGKGDLCPVLTLSSKDFICARKQHSLLDYLQTIRSKHGEKSVPAKIYPWSSGTDILELLKQIHEKMA